MNERIKELVDQAKDWAYADHDGYTAQMLFEQKFAELIVKECANQATWHQDTNAKDIGGELLKYFGVEE